MDSPAEFPRSKRVWGFALQLDVSATTKRKKRSGNIEMLKKVLSIANYSPRLIGTSTVSTYKAGKRPTFLNIPFVWSRDQTRSYSRSSQIT